MCGRRDTICESVSLMLRKRSSTSRTVKTLPPAVSRAYSLDAVRSFASASICARSAASVAALHSIASVERAGTADRSMISRKSVRVVILCASKNELAAPGSGVISMISSPVKPKMASALLTASFLLCGWNTSWSVATSLRPRIWIWSRIGTSAMRWRYAGSKLRALWSSLYVTCARIQSKRLNDSAGTPSSVVTLYVSQICPLESRLPMPRCSKALHTAVFQLRNFASWPSAASSQLSTGAARLGLPISCSLAAMFLAAALKLSWLFELPSPNTACGMPDSTDESSPLLSAVQNCIAFVGSSPWPYVDVTTRSAENLCAPLRRSAVASLSVTTVGATPAVDIAKMPAMRASASAVPVCEPYAMRTLGTRTLLGVLSRASLRIDAASAPVAPLSATNLVRSAALMSFQHPSVCTWLRCSSAVMVATRGFDGSNCELASLLLSTS